MGADCQWKAPEKRRATKYKCHIREWLAAKKQGRALSIDGVQEQFGKEFFSVEKLQERNAIPLRHDSFEHVIAWWTGW